MNKVNIVSLEGFINSCRIEDRGADGARAVMSVFTVHPEEGFPGEAPSKKSTRSGIMLVTGISDGQKRRFEALQGRRLVKEGVLVTFSALGSLRINEDGQSAVFCREGDFSFTDTLRYSDNNNCKITGTVDAVSFTNDTALLTVDLDEGDGKVRVHVNRQADSDIWNRINGGQFAKGDSVYLTGALNSDNYSDGKSFRSVLYVMPSKIEKVRGKKIARPGRR